MPVTVSKFGSTLLVQPSEGLWGIGEKADNFCGGFNTYFKLKLGLLSKTELRKLGGISVSWKSHMQKGSRGRSKSLMLCSKVSPSVNASKRGG
jgi:hypothetical protein